MPGCCTRLDNLGKLLQFIAHTVLTEFVGKKMRRDRKMINAVSLTLEYER
jgi:hypothetical protein